MTADPNLIRTLRYKAHELRRLIAKYEEAAQRTRRDLVTIMSALAIFHKEDGMPDAFVRHTELRGLFLRDEVWVICRRALQAEPDGLTTRQLAVICLEAKGYDHTNAILRRSMGAIPASNLHRKMRRKMIEKAGTVKGCASWRLRAPIDTLPPPE